MITQYDLIDKILYLNPNAKCSVWDNLDTYMGEENPFLLDGYLVSWNPANDFDPPTQKDLDNIDSNLLEARKEERRKEIRNSEKVNDLTIISSYSIAKQSNSKLSFSDYLDQLEQISQQLQNG